MKWTRTEVNILHYFFYKNMIYKNMRLGMSLNKNIFLRTLTINCLKVNKFLENCQILKIFFRKLPEIKKILRKLSDTKKILRKLVGIEKMLKKLPVSNKNHRSLQSHQVKSSQRCIIPQWCIYFRWKKIQRCYIAQRCIYFR